MVSSCYERPESNDSTQVLWDGALEMFAAEVDSLGKKRLAIDIVIPLGSWFLPSLMLTSFLQFLRPPVISPWSGLFEK